MILPLELPELSIKEVRRFWNRVHKHGPDECWYFGQGRSRPIFHVGGVNYKASRIAWKIKTGDDPGDLYVCHSCDNELCVNPNHLFLGTCADNLQDMARKGRSSKGEKNGQAKLTSEDVKRIKSLLSQGLMQEEIAALFNVRRQMISKIKLNLRWSHV